MSLLLCDEARYAALGKRLVKLAFDAPEPVYALAGKLYLSSSGWLLLSVPNGLVRSIYENLDEVGVELPPGKDGQPFNAHISVMRASEIEEIGGPDVISERGHMFHYNIGRLATVVPAGWDEMSKCWLLQVSSPELMQLRRSYGLSSLPQRNGESLGFHITCAVKKKGVLQTNATSKVSTDVNEISRVLRQARKDTDTDPTEAQREAGNYAKGKLRLHGLEISLENPKGSTRSGVSPDGKKWESVLKHDYGYIRGTEGNDGDHVDVFLHADPVTELVFIVNQNKADGSFDEHKALVGFGTAAEAEQAYLANYEDGWNQYGEITPMTVPLFKWWLEHGDQTKPIEDGMFAKHRRKSAAADGAMTAGIKVRESYDPICPHCDKVMYEKHFVPDREDSDLWRHRGDCYDKGPFRIEWPDQAERDAEAEAFSAKWRKAAFDLAAIPNTIGKIPSQIADSWNALSPESQGNTVQVLGSMGVGAGMNAITGAVSAEPGYRAEAAKRDAFRGLINGLAGYAAFKGTQHMFNDSGQQPVAAAISGLGGLALSKALYGAGYPLERAIFGRPSWDVLPEDLAALREDLEDDKQDQPTKAAAQLANLQ